MIYKKMNFIIKDECALFFLGEYLVSNFTKT